MGFLDRLLAGTFPDYQMRRLRAMQITNAYEAAKPTRTHRATRESRGPNQPVGEAAKSLRDQVRYLEQNTDIVNGALDVLVSNTVGLGIRPEFALKKRDGSLHEEANQLLAALWTEWSRYPEVTGEFDEFAAQRLTARSLYRDGEVFLQHIVGPSRVLNHNTRVLYSYELIDADMVPIEPALGGTAARVLQGVELNDWGRAVAYYVYRDIPNDVLRGNRFNGALTAEAKRVSADNMTHLKISRRIRQVRGVSIFASVLKRLADIEEIDETERVAARIAAAMAAYIKKGEPMVYQSPAGGREKRELQFEPGMVFDDLEPGEDVGTIVSNRPNNALIPFRAEQLRSAAGGIGTSYSSLSKNYNGTYSAQRQEMVEQRVIYGTMWSYFVERCERPKQHRFIDTVLLQPQLFRFDDIDPASIYDCTFSQPAMPWIQPLQEANAYQALYDLGVTTRSDIIRSRGQEPREVAAQRKLEETLFGPPPAPAKAGPAQPVEQPDPPDSPDAPADPAPNDPQQED